MSDQSQCKSKLNQLLNRVSSGITWNIIQTKSACPPKKKKFKEEDSESKKSFDEDLDNARSYSGPKKSPYLTPSQICPSTKPCCVIKMQDPCAPCCCEDIPPKLPPCPPRHGPQEPRAPVCGCDLCQREGGNNKCCDGNKGFRGVSLDPRYFEKA